jgi:hypothetical protein
MRKCFRGIERPFWMAGLFWHSGPKRCGYVFMPPPLRSGLLIGVISGLLLCSDQGSARPLDKRPPLRHDAMLVLDNSASMKTVDPHFLLRKVVKDFIAATEGSTRLGVVVFDERARLLVPLTSLDTESREQMSGMLDRLDYTGALSDLPRGIERAVYELRNRGRPDVAKSVFFVTDGIVDIGGEARVAKGTGWLTGELAAQAADEAIGLYGIALSEKADYRLFQSLSYVTKADYFRALDAQEISPILEEITERLQSSVRPGSSANARRVPVSPAPLPGTKETETASAARVSIPSTEKPILALPLGGSATWPLLAGAAGVLTRSFVWIWGAVSLTLLAVLALVVWALLRRGRKAGQGERAGAVAAAAPSPQEAVPRAFLYDVGGATDSELHDVSNKVTVIGRPVGAASRDESCGQLPLADPTISRRHAIIEYRQHCFWLIDQRSRNGTYVGGERVLNPLCLKHNDRITLSKIDFEFHVAAMDDAAETVLMRA